MGRFEIKAPLFEVAEELLYAPSLPVKIESFFAREAIAHDIEMTVSSAFALNDLTGKKDLHSPEFFSFRHSGFSCDSMFSSCSFPDRDVAFYSYDVAGGFVVQTVEPFLTSELPIHGQDVDLFRPHDAEKIFENGDSLPGVGVAPLCLLGKDFPDDGDGDIVDDDSDGENVDVPFPVFPIRAIHGEGPAFRGLGDFSQDESTEGDQRDRGVEEKILESAVATFVLGTC